MDSISSVQNKNFSGDGRGVYENFSSRRKSRKSFIRIILSSLAKPVKSYPEIVAHLYLTVTRQMVSVREQYAELRKELLQYCCNQFWTKNDELILCNVTAICKIFRGSNQTGKHLMNDDLENLSEDQ